LHRFEEVVRAGTGKDCDTICGRLYFLFDVIEDALDIAIEALTLG
jgi:hypothetical protein